MTLKLQTNFGETLDLNITTQVMKISGAYVCFVKVNSGSQLIRKSFGGFQPNQFKWADEQAATLKMLTGATIKFHQNECNRRHGKINHCNTEDSDLNYSERKLR